MKLFFCLLSILLFLLFSCHGIEKEGSEIKDTDTIKVKNLTSLKLDDEYSNLLNNYRLRFGIAISKYYVIDDSLSIDLNKDGIMDTLVVLSPLSLEDVKYSDRNIELKPARLLVEILNNNNKSKIRNIYSNLISNIGGGLSKYNGIFPTERGFEIRHESGSRYSWTYSTEFTIDSPDSLTLLRIKKTCSFDGQEKDEEYLFNSMSVKNINIQDTIQNNCKCDSIWKTLEDKG